MVTLTDTIDAAGVPDYLAAMKVGAVVSRVYDGELIPVRIDSIKLDDSQVHAGIATITLFCSPV